MKKIVILSAFLSPFRSGAEACAEEVSLALRGKFDFVIITAKLRNDLPQTDMLHGTIPVIRIGLGRPIDKWLYPFLAPFAARRQRPAVIHAVLETFAGLALLLCTWIPAKRILTCQTLNRNFLRGPIVRSPDIVTVISSALQRAVQVAGRDDVVHIPNGVPLARIRDAMNRHPRQKRILSVGRLEQMKGVDTLLRAYASLATTVPLRIVGDGSLRTQLENLAQTLGIGDRVTFTGYIPEERIAQEFAEAETFCGLSRSEGLGNVFLEAQAAGCAVIGTVVGGIPDIIEHDRTGILVAPDAPGAAADALRSLLDDAKLRERLARAGQEHAELYDWSVIAAKYAELYERPRTIAAA